jgi:putative DNA methylase
VSETTRKKKLIEVALPLDEINAACKADKDRKTGTLRNIHKWFAPMPLPAWRALLFAALVDDPVDDNRRVYLLDLIKRLVGSGADVPDSKTIREANSIIRSQYPNGQPIVMDPFCGGGSTLVEAQRLGLSALGSDLNPVPAIISRALTEICPGLHGRQPLHPEAQEVRPKGRVGVNAGLFAPTTRVYEGLDGLARDITYYAEVVNEELERTARPLYPARPGEQIVAWIWVRTAQCRNPACGAETLLTTSWWLSKKKGDLAWVEPSVVGRTIDLNVRSRQRVGQAPTPSKVGDAVFECLVCSNTIGPEYLRPLGKAGKLGLRLAAIVSEVDGRRTYRAPDEADFLAVKELKPIDVGLEIPINPSGQGVRVTGYGFVEWADLYTLRQLHSMDLLVEAVSGIRGQVLLDRGDEAWANAIVTFLALAVGKRAQVGSAQSRWKLDSRSGTGKAEGAFARPDLPMTWDFPEAALLDDGAGNWLQCVKTMLDSFQLVPQGDGKVRLSDARVARSDGPTLVATDPPYFDAIGYADLSDFFYLWHRRILRDVHPDLYATIATPKVQELTALPGRYDGDRAVARDYFVDGFTQTFENLKESAGELPIVIVYASKEQKGGVDEESRWASILNAMIAADLEITGTWPIHGTGSTRMRGQGSNAVATYIAMVCRPRAETASTCSLAEFTRALRRELGSAVRDLQAASILPIDLAQAAMGPGMQIYSRYRAVLDQSGNRVPVDHALRLINSALGEVLDEQEGELDAESRFAVRWWETYGWEAGAFGEADKTARPLGISVEGDVVRAQVATSQANRVQLLGRAALDRSWTPSKDIRPTAWEAVHHLADRLIDGGGELEAARLMGAMGSLQDSANSLVYRLHDIAAKKARAGDQERYNALINSWAELVKLGSDGGAASIDGLF